MRPAKIKLVIAQDGNSTSTLYAEGIVTFLNNGIYVEFCEDDHGQKTLIGYSEGTVTLTRIGEMSYTMILDEGKPSVVSIDTGYGKMDLNLWPEKICHTLEGNDLEIQLEYAVSAPMWDLPVRHKIMITGKLEDRYI